MYERLAQALAPLVELDRPLRYEDLNEKGSLSGGTWDERLERRARRTDEVLDALASGTNNAPQIVDHPLLTLEIGGTTAYLEPDALAFRVGQQLELVEIKSYAIIDGQADPSKLASMASQSAVYLIAMRRTHVCLVRQESSAILITCGHSLRAPPRGDLLEQCRSPVLT